MDTRPAASRLLASLPLLAAAAFLTWYWLAARQAVGGEVGYPLDDSYIHLQFARQLAAGQGFSFNPGEPSTGSTSPLWSALLAIGFFLPGFSLLWPKLLGIFCLGATVLGARRLLEQLGATPLFQQGGALLVATTPRLLWSALSGMEILLFASLVLWAMIWAGEDEENRPEAPGPAAPCCAAVAVLARPEGLLLVGLLLLQRACRLELGDSGPTLRRRPLWGVLKAGALALLVVLPLILNNYTISGSIWPSTLGVKAIPDGDPLPSGRYFPAALQVFWETEGILFLFAGAGALLVLRRAGERLAVSLLPVAFFFGLPLAYSLMGSDLMPPLIGNFGRYLYPLMPILVAFAMLAIDRGLAPFDRGLMIGRARIPLRAGVLGALVLLQLFQAYRGRETYVTTIRNVADSNLAAVGFLAERLPAEALIATHDIGAVKLFLPNRILDLCGIVGKAPLPYLYEPDPARAKELFLSFLAVEQPDVILAFDNSFPLWLHPSAGYEKIAAFEVPHNITMAGDRLLLLKTPWCRFCDALGEKP